MFGLREKSRRSTRFAACLLAALLAFAGNSFGQGRVEKGSPLATKIERVKKVRVRTPQGELTLLRPVILDAGIASRIMAGGEELQRGYNEATLVSWKDVREIRVRRTAALIGAIAGLGVGGLLGAVMVEGLTEGDASAGDYFKGIAYLGIPGVLLGAAAGSAITRWQRIYAAPSGSGPVMQVSIVPVRRGGAAFSLALSF
jgi:hypothetical protein